MDKEPIDWLKKPIIDDGVIFIDCSRFYVSSRGEEIKLTVTQLKILYLLAAVGGKIVSRRSLINDVTDRQYYMNEKTISVHISVIRTKLPDDCGINLRPIWNLGYRYEKLPMKIRNPWDSRGWQPK